MMQRIKLFLVLLVGCVSFCLSCNRDYRIAQARIVERRDIGNGKTRLSYLFKAGQTTIAGVKVVDAAVIVSSDSCTVEYKVSNPLENSLKLP